VSVNHLQIKTMMPLHGDEIAAVVEKSQRLIIIENNQSGQFARHLRAETGIVAHGHIRKYDGEPFEPKHIVSAVNDIIGGQEVVDVLSIEPGWRTDHPTGTSGPWEGLKQVTRPGVPSKA
jgi:2-oxoglutarate ferredoxin oxidoreductase subunit alpha